MRLTKNTFVTALSGEKFVPSILITDLSTGLEVDGETPDIIGVTLTSYVN